MSLMRCRSCSTRFAVGLLRCPQCQQVSELYAVPEHVAAAEEENMPKITVGGGASNAAEGTVADEVPVPDEAQVPAEPAAETVEAVEEEPAGTTEPEPAVEPEAAAVEAAPAPKTRKKASPAAS